MNGLAKGERSVHKVIDFCRLAQAMGVKSKKVERPENLKRVLNEAVRSGEPRLVEVIVENAP